MCSLACVIVSRIFTSLEKIFCIKDTSCSAWIKVLTVHLCPHELETCTLANWWMIFERTVTVWKIEIGLGNGHKMETDGSNNKLFLFFFGLYSKIHYEKSKPYNNWLYLTTWGQHNKLLTQQWHIITFKFIKVNILAKHWQNIHCPFCSVLVSINSWERCLALARLHLRVRC